MNRSTDSQLDGHLQTAVSGVHDELLDLSVPDFVPTPNRRPGMGAALILLVIGSLGFFMTRATPSLQVETPVAEAPETITETDVATTNQIGSEYDLEDFENGVEVSRVSNAEPGEYIMPIAPSWNADGSLLLLYRTVEGEGGKHVLYDADTFEVVKELSIDPSDIEQVFWSPVDPNQFFYFKDNSLLSYDVKASIKRWITTFDDCSDLQVSDSVFSWDGETIGFTCVLSSGDRWTMIYELGGSRNGVPLDPLTPPIVLASGDGLVVTREVSGSDGLELVVLNADLQETGVTFAVTEDSFVATQAADGSDLLVGTVFDGSSVGTVVAIDPWTGEQVALVGPDTGFSYPPSGSLLSVQNWQSPGRIAVSILGDPSTNQGPGSTFDPGLGWAGELGPDGSDQLSGRVLIIDLGDLHSGGTSTVVRSLAFHQSSGETDSLDYWASTFVSMDPTGSKVLFSSDAGSGTQVDTYLIEVLG